MAFVACKAGTSTSGVGGGQGATTTTVTGGTTSVSATASGTSATTGGFMTGSTGSGTTGGVAEVFAESADTLYKLDPNTKAVSVVAPFSGCGGNGVIDIALDKDSNLFATTYDGIYRVDRTTAKCTLVKNGTYPNSLSFVPAGTLDPNVEALVGYNGDQYLRIDTTTGNITNIGSPWSNGLVSSGDIVSVIGGATYLTVKGTSCGDCLVEVNPKTGAMTKNWGDLGHSNVFGIAFWAGSVYGFDDVGEIFEVTFTNNVMMTHVIMAPPGVSFYGAGSTTSAPPTPQ